MSIDIKKVKKIIKNYYHGEIEKIDIPESPFPPAIKKHNWLVGMAFSVLLTVGCLIFLLAGFTIRFKPSPLAKQIAIFSKNIDLDKALLEGIDYLRSKYNLRTMEE